MPRFPESWHAFFAEKVFKSRANIEEKNEK
jgi:hypothetical protein